MSNTYKAGDNSQTDAVETLNFEPIKGYPMLNWRGKRPFTSTHFYPAQLKEQHGSEVDGWLNKIYWGDNLQVMSHLLKHYRGQVKLIYIDPPFDSKADYTKKINLHGRIVRNDSSAFEEKQYGDIWTNDDYLQFIYERVVIMRELLSDNGSLWFHCDWHRSHHLRCILDEIFGQNNLQNEVVWQRTDPHNDAKSRLGWIHDTLFWYAKNRDNVTYNWQEVATALSNAALKEYSLFRLENGDTVNYSPELDGTGRRFKLDDCTYKGENSERRFAWRGARPSDKRVWPYKTLGEMDAAVERGEFYLRNPQAGAARCRVSFLDEREGQLLQTIWTDTGRMKGGVEYPTQKPLSLLERIILASSDSRDLMFDGFMGSGTSQIAAMKLGRRFLGADINLGAVQLTTKKLIAEAFQLGATSEKLFSVPDKLTLDLIDEIAEDEEVNLPISQLPTAFYTGFEVYNVNNYEIFRNPVEAKELLGEALELQKLQAGHLFDGERDGRMWKIMPVNKIATRQDLNEIIAGLNLKSLADRLQAAPNQPAEKITLVCMGHEPDLAATLNQEVALNLNVKAGTKMPLDVQVLDILRDRGDLQFKRDSEAKVEVKGKKLVIQAFYPMNLLSKLSLEKEKVGDWREMVDSVMVDFNYDGAVFNPALVDIPEKNALVAGSYPVPADAGTIRVKITDVLSESLELEVPA